MMMHGLANFKFETKYVLRLATLYNDLLLFHYWLLVSASKGQHQTNIYKKLKMLVHIVQKGRYYGIPVTIITSLRLCYP